jgi:hypothetical protein
VPYKDPEKQRAVQRDLKRAAKLWFRDFKATLKCTDCGMAHPAAIQFHHEGAKEAGVSRLVNKNCSVERIMAEVRKCVVLCANCHVIRHYNAGYYKSPKPTAG